MSGAGDGAAMGRGRGRGRGLSNLPAWLVEKQRREQTGAVDGSGDVAVVLDSPTASSTAAAQIDDLGRGRGRGRGRGISNLPAWLVEKERKEAAGGQ